MKNTLYILLILITGSLLQCKKLDVQTEEPQSASSKTAMAAKEGSDEFKPNEVLVTFKYGEGNDIIRTVGGSVKEKVHTKAMQHFGNKPFFILTVPDVSNAVEALKHNPNVESVSPNYIIKIPEEEINPSYVSEPSVSKTTRIENINKISGVPVFNPPSLNNKTVSTTAYPNDPIYTSGDQWGANNIKAPQAWATNKGSQQIYVGLIDEGIFHWHPDLCGQIWKNPFETQNGIDDDGNGYIDDIHGWDFYHNDSTIFDFSDGHGTHTAGTIGANTDNAIGVAGISPNVTIVSAKFLQQSGTLDAAIKAIDYITDLKIRHNMNFVATSNSWGYQGEFVQVLSDAVNRERQAGILFIAAAGNNAGNNDVSDFWPANLSLTLDNVISVAAIDVNNNLASFSNYGATSVHIGAPGVGIWSTLYNSNLDPIYANFSGTSMAAPHVSGAAALYKAGHPTATYLQVKNAILNNARAIPALTGKSTTGGTLDASTFTQSSTDVPVARTCQAQLVDLTPPTQVQNVRVTNATNTTLTITWDAASDPESGIWFYGLYITQGGTGYQQISTYNTSIVHGGLTQATQYCYTVYAINNQGQQSIGSVTFCTSTTGVPDTEPPAVPQNLRLIASGITSLTFQWDASPDNRATTGYDVQLNNLAGNYGAGGWTSFTIIEFSNLLPNDTYWMIVRAFDAAGNKSAWCDTVFASTGIPIPDITPPTTPTGLNVSATVNSLTLNWSPSTDNINVTGYKVFINNDTFTTTNTSHTFGGLTSNTTYPLGVNAFDAAGNFSGNATINGTTLTPPPPVFNVSSVLNGTANGLNVSLEWSITTNGNISLVQLQEKKGGGGSWQTINTAPNNATGGYNYTVSTPGQYYYRLFVTITQGVSSYSNEKNIQVKKR